MIVHISEDVGLVHIMIIILSLRTNIYIPPQHWTETLIYHHLDTKHPDSFHNNLEIDANTTISKLKIIDGKDIKFT